MMCETAMFPAMYGLITQEPDNNMGRTWSSMSMAVRAVMPDPHTASTTRDLPDGYSSLRIHVRIAVPAINSHIATFAAYGNPADCMRDTMTAIADHVASR